jgi:hypothetical protein
MNDTTTTKKKDLLLLNKFKKNPNAVSLICENENRYIKLGLDFHEGYLRLIKLG